MWHRDSTHIDQDDAEMLCAALLSIGRVSRIVAARNAPGWTVEVWIPPTKWMKAASDPEDFVHAGEVRA